MVNRWIVQAGLGLVLMAQLVVVALFFYAGEYGLNTVLTRGGTYWVSVGENDPRLSPAMRLALQRHPPAVTTGSFIWRQLQDGFEVAEMPVLARGREIERILLARIDPALFRFEVRALARGDRELGDWMDETKAALIINGSYFGRYGEPDTPIVSNGTPMGPKKYSATHGAFTVKKGRVQLVDLRNRDWRQVLAGVDQALVSYPLLVSSDKARKVRSNPRWLANRSFLGLDKEGRVVLGTTRDAFFSLERLAAFLRRAPLDLAFALNLDGGPLACQGVALNGYWRDFCGQWETSTSPASATGRAQLKLLRPVFGPTRWNLPLVLAAFPRMDK